eukprot:352724-Chlamydomonas_euryale.AAC.6
MLHTCTRYPAVCGLAVVSGALWRAKLLNPGLKSSACHVSHLQAVPNGEWPELLSFLEHCGSSGSADHRETAIGLFASLAENIGGCGPGVGKCGAL